jgi:hypothetical protein
MDRQKLLKKLGLTQQELDELISKRRNFLRSLNPAQRRVLEASLPKTTTVIKTFGTDCSEQDLLELCGQEEVAPRILAFCVPEGGGDLGQ